MKKLFIGLFAVAVNFSAYAADLKPAERLELDDSCNTQAYLSTLPDHDLFLFSIYNEEGEIIPEAEKDPVGYHFNEWYKLSDKAWKQMNDKLVNSFGACKMTYWLGRAQVDYKSYLSVMNNDFPVHLESLTTDLNSLSRDVALYRKGMALIKAMLANCRCTKI